MEREMDTDLHSEDGDKLVSRVEDLLAKLSADTSTPVRPPERLPSRLPSRLPVDSSSSSSPPSPDSSTYLPASSVPLRSVEQWLGDAETSDEDDDHVRFAKCLRDWPDQVNAEELEEAETAFGNRKTLSKYIDSLDRDMDSLWLKRSKAERGSMRQVFHSERRQELERGERLRQERETWKLLEMLHSSGGESNRLSHLEEFIPQMEIELLFDREKDLQLWDTVARWFHTCTQKSEPIDKSLQETSLPYLSATVKRLREKGLMQQEYRHGELVKQIDPDAMIRNVGNVLDEDDEADLVAMLEEVWKLIRHGAFYNTSNKEVDTYTRLMEQVRDLCSAFGQTWRVASLAGGKPVVIDAKTKERKGNDFRAVWRHACCKLAARALERSEGSTQRNVVRAAQLEHIIYALLGGDLDQVLGSTLCTSWEDMCWASFRCMVEARLDVECNEKRREFINRIYHVRGPIDDTYEDTTSRRADGVLMRTPTDVFDAVADEVPVAEKPFFTVQRAFIEGHFRRLLVGDADGGFNLCELFCGPHWRLASQILVSHICGEGFFERSSGQKLPPEVAGFSAQMAPCWHSGNLAFAMQFLRFLTHASIYMNRLSSVGSPVTEDTPADSVVNEALVVTYLDFLLRDKTNMLERYAEIPVFFVDLSPVTRLAVQSAMFEVAAVADGDDRSKLLTKWEKQYFPPALYHRAMAQAFRNVHRQWLEAKPPCPTVFAAIQELLFKKQQSEDMEAAAERPNKESVLEIDLRFRLMDTWEWLENDSSAWLESVVLGNTVLRELVLDEFSPQVARTKFCDQRIRSMQLAKDFVRNHLNNLHHQLSKMDQQPEPCIQLSRLSKDKVSKEFKSWELFLLADDNIQKWKEGALWLQTEAQNNPAVFNQQNLPNDMTETARATASAILETLKQEGGFLVDPPQSESVPFNYTDDQAVNEDLVEIEQDELRRSELLGHSPAAPGELRTTCVLYLVNSLMSIVDQAVYFLDSFQSCRQMQFELNQIALRIAEVLADDSLYLLPCFSKEEVRAILERLRLTGNNLVRLQLCHPKLGDWL